MFEPYLKGIEWLKSLPGGCVYHNPPATIEQIHATEQAIGSPLPPSYVQFLLYSNGAEVGTSVYSLRCIYGTDGIVRETRKLRAGWWPDFNPITKNFIVFAELESPNPSCFDTTRLGAREGEYMIVYLEHDGTEIIEYNTSFDRWLNALSMRRFLLNFYGVSEYVKEESEILELLEAVNLDSDIFQPNFELAEALYKLGILDHAERLFQRCLSLIPPKHSLIPNNVFWREDFIKYRREEILKYLKSIRA
jgi:tetratricopeptide (TPR) repeat protein